MNDRPCRKRGLGDLAAFGGPQAFPEALHVGRPGAVDPRRLSARIQGALERCWLSNDGPLVREFEERVAARLGVPHCVAVANGTMGLEIAARALDLRGEVIVPAMTFVATATALSWQGLRPVFCDVDTRTGCLDPASAERALTVRTSAILGVHLFGTPCAPDALADVASRSGVRLLFDAAHAFDCSHGGTMIGGFGDAEVFSFHATKIVSCAEGGLIATRDAQVARRARQIRNFGFDGPDRVACLGINGKMSELAAAMGLTSLEGLDATLEANRRNHAAYRRHLANLRGVSLLEFPPAERRNHQYVVLQVRGEETGLDRDALFATLQAENVLARRYFHPGLHRLETYRSEGGTTDLPAADRFGAGVLCVPTGPQLGPAEVEVVCDLIALAAEHGPELTRRWARERPSETAAAPHGGRP